AVIDPVWWNDVFSYCPVTVEEKIVQKVSLAPDDQAASVEVVSGTEEPLPCNSSWDEFLCRFVVDVDLKDAALGDSQFFRRAFGVVVCSSLNLLQGEQHSGVVHTLIRGVAFA